MAFNPDDFQFERILPPEERKPILEWDALHRIMVVRVKVNGEWTYHATLLNKQVNDNLHEYLPDEWSNANDRIVSFSIFEDGDHIFEKEKLKFDFTNKTSKWMRYQKNDLTEGQVRELFDILKAALAVQQTDETVLKSKALVDLATTEEYISRSQEENEEKLTKLLRASDWTQLADAADTFPDEIELWGMYRTFLRNNVKTPSDFDDLLDYLIWEEEYSWPIDPFTYHTRDPEHTVEYLSVPAHFTYMAETSGEYALKTLVGSVSKAAIIAKKNQDEGGIPIHKQIWDKVNQYKLNEGLTGAVIENLNITEE